MQIGITRNQDTDYPNLKTIDLFLEVKIINPNIIIMEAVIELRKGYGNLSFGQTPEQVLGLMGTPDEVEQIGEEMEMPTTVLHYDEQGVALFFETGEQEKLVCINVESKEMTLFGEKIFGKSKKEIETLLKQNSISDIEHDNEEWGEERLGSEDNSIDFYFSDDKLESVTIGR